MKVGCCKWLGVAALAIWIGFGIPVSAAEKKAPDKKDKPLVTEEKKSQDNVVKAPDKVAVVNGTVIPFTEFDRELNQFKMRVSMQGQTLDEPQLSEIKKEILENLIGRELLFQESKKNGIQVEAKAIEDELASMKKMFPDEAAFKEAVGQMGYTEETLKAQIEKGLTVQRFVEKQFSEKTAVSDKETKEFYDANPDKFREPEQVKASHILIKTDPKADPSEKDAAHKKAESIQQQIKEGKDFAELAKQNSDDPGSKDNGGDLGFFRRGNMVKPFEDAAFALAPGSVSDIVETRFGYHLIKVTEKKPEGMMAYEMVKDKLNQYLKNEKLQKELLQYVTGLKEKATIQRFL